MKLNITTSSEEIKLAKEIALQAAFQLQPNSVDALLTQANAIYDWLTKAEAATHDPS